MPPFLPRYRRRVFRMLMLASFTLPAALFAAVVVADFSTLRAASAVPVDFDGDGRPDLLERALGTSSAVANTTEPLFSGLTVQPDAFDVTYTRAADVSRFKPTVEASVDLATWTTGNVTQEHALAAAGDGRVQVTARIQPAAPAQYARLRATDLRRLDALTPAATRELFARLLVYWHGKVNATGTRDTFGSQFSYEWVTRMVVPMAAWLSQPGRPGVLGVDGVNVDVAEALRRALVNGTDPAHPDRWPAPNGQHDQIIVESPLVAYATWIVQQSSDRPGAPCAPLWSAITPAQRTALEAFFVATANNGHTYANNWNLFITVNHEARKRMKLAGVPEFSGASQSVINGGLAKIQAMHRGGGWYADSATEHIFDDYLPYVILPEQMNHFIMGHADTQAQTVIPNTGGRGRAQILADISSWLKFQVRGFDAAGGNVEYGRSSSYKFARLRPLIQAYYLDRVFNTPERWNLGFKVLPPEITPGMLRRLVRLHLGHYLANGAIVPVTFQLGKGQTADSSPEILESYTHDGSAYWAMNALGALFLLPDDDPFWSAPEQPLPAETAAYENWYEQPGFLLRNLPAQGHVELFNARVTKNAWMTDDYFNKYTKFVYSSRFGYCTKSGSRLDQSIMVGSGYRQNPSSGDYFVPAARAADDPGVFRSTHVQGAATVKTLIFLRDGLQVRVHRVLGAAGQRVRDGGYALGHASNVSPPSARTGADWIYLESPEVGAVLVARLLGYTSVAAQSGTGNHSRQARWRIPYADTPSASSATFHCAALLHADAARFDPAAVRARVGGVAIQGDTATVTWGDGKTVSATFE